MPPPQLAGDAPVLDVFHPMPVGVLEFFWDELDFVGLHRVQGRLGQFRHADPPLQRQAGFHHRSGAFGRSNRRGVLFHLGQQALGFQIRRHLFPGGKPVHAGVLQPVRAERAVFVQYVQGFQAVLLANGKVVPVVCRGHFEATGTKVQRHVLVGNDGNEPTAHGNPHPFAVQRQIPLVLGVYGNGHVAHKRFRPGGSHRQVGSGSILQFVPNVVQFGLDVLVDHFFVGQRRLGLGVPMDHAQPAVDVPLFVQVYKYLVNAFGTRLVHGKGRAVPVAAGAQLFELFQDDSPVFVGPFPGVLQKGIAGEVGLLNAFCTQLLYDFGFGGNGGVVGPRNPTGIEPTQPGAAHQNVLNGVVEHVAHVQNAGHVGRRNDNGVGLPVVRDGLKMLIFQPVGIPFGFDRLRRVFAGKFHRLQKYALASFLKALYIVPLCVHLFRFRNFLTQSPP